MGFDWPASPLFFCAIVVILLLSLWFHAQGLIKGAPSKIAFRLILLRIVALVFLFLLLGRPYLEQEQLDQSRFRLLSLVDLSESMEVRDDREGKKRSEEVRPHFNSLDADSWINQQRQNYGKVDVYGFSEERKRLIADEWNINEIGSQTALGDALARSLAQSDDEPESPLGSLVVFSDGRNNFGRNLLEVGNEFRARGIPVNIIGVGKDRAKGDLRISFDERNPRAVAKEDLLLSANLINEFSNPITTQVNLFLGDEKLDEISVEIQPGGSRKITFDPIVPKTAGTRRYRIEVVPPEGDVDAANDLDTLLVEVKPPLQFSILYISNQTRPL